MTRRLTNALVIANLFAAAAASAQTYHYELVHAFGIDSDEGGNPSAALVQADDGNFYGTTTALGGPDGAGTIFRMDPAARVTPLHSFPQLVPCYIDTTKPYSPLLQATDGNLYGTTCRQPADLFEGTAFRIDLSGHFMELHRFSGIPEGAHPIAPLIQATDGLFYGTTAGGAADPSFCSTGACGAVFKMDSAGNVTTLHDFSDSGDGAYPQAPLVQAADGNFYGTTAGGLGGPGCPFTGACATAFKMDSSGQVFPMHSFGADYPNSALLQALDGNFYSTTRQGGSFGHGSVFRMDSLGGVTTLHSFDVTTSAYPSGPLLAAPNDTFYGMTAGCCGFSDGTIFTIETDETFATIHDFNGSDGANPSGGLLRAADGSLYGTAPTGGPGGGGVIFRLTSASFAVNAIQPSSGPGAGTQLVYVLGGGIATEAGLTIGGIPAIGVTVPDPTFVRGTTPALKPGTLYDVTVTNPGSAARSSGTLIAAYLADFLDVAQSDTFHDYVEKIFRHAITAGYGNGNYGRNDPVTRAQMAVFLLKSEHGSTYMPPPCAGIFDDVPCPSSPNFPYSDWIEQLSAESVTGGCLLDPLRYCPDRTVTRAEMSVLLLRTEHGVGYQPPPCAGIFGDVPCPSSPDFPYSDWIEQLSLEGVTAGCGNGNYCPDQSNTRGEMAVFLVKTFRLQ